MSPDFEGPANVGTDGSVDLSRARGEGPDSAYSSRTLRSCGEIKQPQRRAAKSRTANGVVAELTLEW